MYRTESVPSSLEKGLADCHGEERRETLQVKVIMMSQEVSPVTSLRTRHGVGAGERQAFPVGHGRNQQSEPATHSLGKLGGLVLSRILAEEFNQAGRNSER